MVLSKFPVSPHDLTDCKDFQVGSFHLRCIITDGFVGSVFVVVDFLLLTLRSYLREKLLSSLRGDTGLEHSQPSTSALFELSPSEWNFSSIHSIISLLGSLFLPVEKEIGG